MQECRRHRVLKPPCISAGTRGELCGCCGSERCSWQSCVWCCCRSEPRAEKNPAGDELNCMGHFFFQVQISYLSSCTDQNASCAVSNFAWNGPLTVPAWVGAVSQARPISTKREGPGIQAMCCCTVYCASPITLQYLVTWHITSLFEYIVTIPDSFFRLF